MCLSVSQLRRRANRCKGQIVSHHFAHRASDCGGEMTALHLTAQKVLATESRMTLPQHEFGFGGGRQEFASVELEARVGNRVVDCLTVTESGHRLAVEIRVTHKVDQAK